MCLFGILSAQEQIRGTILIDFADAKASNIHILNKTKNIYAVTDISGHFNIEAGIKDTLEFKGDFLKERNFIVDSWALDNPNLVIHMDVDKIELEELVVKPKLTGDMRKDVKTVPKDKTKEKLYASLGINIKTLDKKPQERRGSLIPAILTLDIITIYKIASGYYRKLDNLREYDAYIKELYSIRDFLGEDFFVNELNLPKSEIEQFLVFAEARNSEIFKQNYTNKSYLPISQLLEKESTTYKEIIKQREEEATLDESKVGNNE